MRAVRSRALAMIQALRTATMSLAREHSAAHGILTDKFAALERSVAGAEEEWAAEEY
jgi:hypothetical protein